MYLLKQQDTHTHLADGVGNRSHDKRCAMMLCWAASCSLRFYRISWCCWFLGVNKHFFFIPHGVVWRNKNLMILRCLNFICNTQYTSTTTEQTITAIRARKAIKHTERAKGNSSLADWNNLSALAFRFLARWERAQSIPQDPPLTMVALLIQLISVFAYDGNSTLTWDSSQFSLKLTFFLWCSSRRAEM